MRAKGRRSFRYRLEKLSVYGPMLAMGVLALATYWLARSVPSPHDDPAAVLADNEPDYQISQFAIRNYEPDGRLTVEIFGQTGRHFPASDMLEVDALRMRAVAEDGRIVTATADTGISNGAGTEMRLHGNAVVVQQATASTPRMEFRGDELQVWPNEERVRSDKPVELVRGQDRMTGDNLAYDKKQQTTTIDGRVRSTLQPGSPSR